MAHNCVVFYVVVLTTSNTTQLCAILLFAKSLLGTPCRAACRVGLETSAHKVVVEPHDGLIADTHCSGFQRFLVGHSFLVDSLGARKHILTLQHMPVTTSSGLATG